MTDPNDDGPTEIDGVRFPAGDGPSWREMSRTAGGPMTYEQLVEGARAAARGIDDGPTERDVPARDHRCAKCGAACEPDVIVCYEPRTDNDLFERSVCARCWPAVRAAIEAATQPSRTR